MGFETEYEEWIVFHAKKSSGERLRRLKEVNREAEKLLLKNVWWPIYGSLKGLFPEYEVEDYQGKSRFIDTALVEFPLLVAWEVDGFGPHLKHISRVQFRDERRRDIQLKMNGWRVVRFAFDDVVEHPRLLQQYVQVLMSRWRAEVSGSLMLSVEEREMVRLAVLHGQLLHTSKVSRHFGVCANTARKMLKDLEAKGILTPVNKDSRRVRAYRLSSDQRLFLP